MLILPGWLFLEVTGWSLDRFPRLSFLPITFVVSLIFVSLLGLIGHVFGLSLILVEAVILAITALFLLQQLLKWALKGLGSSGLNLKESISLPVFSLAEMAMLGFIVVAAGLAFWSGSWLSHTADSFFHIAGVHTLLGENKLLVEGVLYADSSAAGLSPASGTWHLSLALISRISDLNIVPIWGYLPAATAILLITSFYSFAFVLLKNHWWAFLATLIQFAVLFQMDFRASVYPNTISLTILWIVLACALRYLEAGDKKSLLMVWVGGLTLAAVHLFAFEMFALSIGALLVTTLILLYWQRDLISDFKRLLVLLVVPSLSAAALIVVKLQGTSLFSFGNGAELSTEFRNVISLIGNNVVVFNPDVLISPHRATSFNVVGGAGVGASIFSIALSYGLIILLLPRLFKGERASRFLVAATLIVPLLLLNPLVVSPLNGHISDIAFLRMPNIVPFSIVIVHVLVMVGTRLVQTLQGTAKPRIDFSASPLRMQRVARSFVGVFRIRERLHLPRLSMLFAVPALATIVVAGIVIGMDVKRGAFQGYSSSAEENFLSVDSSRSSRLDHENGLYGFLRKEIPPGSVILSDPVTSYYVGGMTGLPVVAVPKSHSVARVEAIDGPQRREDVATVLAPEESDLDEILHILRDYEVMYVVAGASTFKSQSEGAFLEIFSQGVFLEIYAEHKVAVWQGFLEGNAQ